MLVRGWFIVTFVLYLQMCSSYAQSNSSLTTSTAPSSSAPTVNQNSTSGNATSSSSPIIKTTSSGSAASSSSPAIQEHSSTTATTQAPTSISVCIPTNSSYSCEEEMTIDASNGGSKSMSAPVNISEDAMLSVNMSSGAINLWVTFCDEPGAELIQVANNTSDNENIMLSAAQLKEIYSKTKCPSNSNEKIDPATVIMVVKAGWEVAKATGLVDFLYDKVNSAISGGGKGAPCLQVPTWALAIIVAYSLFKAFRMQN